jgi:hypothetical protein
VFPYLSRVDASLVRQGESVPVIGNPGDAMLRRVKGNLSELFRGIRLSDDYARYRFGRDLRGREFHGDAPASLKLAAGSHVVLLKSASFADYMRPIEIPKASKLALKTAIQSAGSP